MPGVGAAWEGAGVPIKGQREGVLRGPGKTMVTQGCAYNIHHADLTIQIT